MASLPQVGALHVAAMSFVAGLLAVTAFGVVVTGDSVQQAALGGLGYAVGGAIGVYIASAGTDVGL